MPRARESCGPTGLTIDYHPHGRNVLGASQILYETLKLRTPKLRVLYVQYTNPAAYPPLQHSSRLLANKGWQVLFLGSGSHGADALQFPQHPNIRVKRMPLCPAGWRQKLDYIRFCVWIAFWSLWWRPRWIY